MGERDLAQKETGACRVVVSAVELIDLVTDVASGEKGGCVSDSQANPPDPLGRLVKGHPVLIRGDVPLGRVGGLLLLDNEVDYPIGEKVEVLELERARGITSEVALLTHFVASMTGVVLIA